MILKRRYLAVFIAIVLIILPESVVLAEETGKTPEEIAAEEEARKQAAYEMNVDSNQIAGWPEGPKVYADSAIVMDMESGAVLYEKRAEEQHYPASITKLLTTLVALEEGELSDTVTFTENSVNFLNYDDANIGMKAGEQISMEDALYAVLLASANEVSYAVAESTGIKMGGGYDTFIERMNERAAEAGCTGSHWVNPHGLHDDAHYTTAHDMARIASAVYEKEEFRTIMSTLEYHIGPTNLVGEERVFQQNHRMLWPENYYYYEYCKGGKTGYTDQSGTTLVTMADNGSMRLAAVVMADYGVSAYEDTRAMLDYAFGNFSRVAVEGQNIPENIEAFSGENSYVVLPAEIDFSQLEYEIAAEYDMNLQNDLPDSPEERSAKLYYSYNGQNVGCMDVTLSQLYFENIQAELQQKEDSKQPVPVEEENQKNQKNLQKDHVRIPIMAGGGVLVAILLAAAFRVRYIRERRRRKSGRKRIGK